MTFFEGNDTILVTILIQSNPLELKRIYDTEDEHPLRSYLDYPMVIDQLYEYYFLKTKRRDSLSFSVFYKVFLKRYFFTEYVPSELREVLLSFGEEGILLLSFGEEGILLYKDAFITNESCLRYACKEGDFDLLNILVKSVFLSKREHFLNTLAYYACHHIDKLLAFFENRDKTSLRASVNGCLQKGFSAELIIRYLVLVNKDEHYIYFEQIIGYGRWNLVDMVPSRHLSILRYAAALGNLELFISRDIPRYVIDLVENNTLSIPSRRELIHTAVINGRGNILDYLDASLGEVTSSCNYWHGTFGTLEWYLKKAGPEEKNFFFKLDHLVIITSNELKLFRKYFRGSALKAKIYAFNANERLVKRAQKLGLHVEYIRGSYIQDAIVTF